MTDQNPTDIVRQLRESERLEGGLTALFASIQPPVGAAERLQARLQDAFHESELTLNDAGPYSFEQAAAAAQRDADGTDLLAAGLEEAPVEDEDDQDD